ncbi:hypothetical protein NLG97_g1280 [Lecanicillium saksenae]|uniref:Uncharacterized protein n=1 Tax=Lecanicillium saksenae TaxID=468837 RepID=A0ACC1R466_9HYPO|nr:hypothetical protein NLG97_g1280 [Lecanicillium saksenae]
MESWGRCEAIHFDPKKTEIMHFSRRKADHSQSPIIYHGDKEIRAATSMRWLGIYLDKKLTFNHHINEWSQKARKVINHLRAMNNTVRGMAATAARRAAWAVAMPTLFHGVDAWLPGLDTGNSHLKDKPGQDTARSESRMQNDSTHVEDNTTRVSVERSRHPASERTASPHPGTHSSPLRCPRRSTPNQQTAPTVTKRNWAEQETTHRGTNGPPTLEAPSDCTSHRHDRTTKAHPTEVL